METPGLDRYENKHILVTGGTGFLGQSVTERLRTAGAIVTSVGSRFDLMHDIHLSDSSPRYNLIFHLAADVAGITKNRALPYTFLHKNAEMAINLVELAVSRHIPVVAAGSVCVYGEEASLPFSESDIFVGNPEISNYGYGMAKRFLLTLLETARMQYHLSFAYLVSANLYGPFDNFNEYGGHVIPDTIRKISRAKFYDIPYVNFYGDGTPSRDFLHVADAADAYLLAGAALLKGSNSFVCNIGSGAETSIAQLIRSVCHLYDFPLNKIAFDGETKQGQMRRLVDSSRARALLGWQAQRSLEDGLKETVSYYEECIARYTQKSKPSPEQKPDFAEPPVAQ